MIQLFAKFLPPLAILVLMTNGMASGDTIGTTASDLRNRSRQIRWPKAFDPAEAKSFAHNELEMRSDCHRGLGVSDRSSKLAKVDRHHQGYEAAGRRSAAGAGLALPMEHHRI